MASESDVMVSYEGRSRDASCIYYIVCSFNFAKAKFQKVTPILRISLNHRGNIACVISFPRCPTTTTLLALDAPSMAVQLNLFHLPGLDNLQTSVSAALATGQRKRFSPSRSVYISYGQAHPTRVAEATVGLQR